MPSFNKVKNIIVTGATGFIGQHLIPQLLDNNFHVIAISRDVKKASVFEWYKEVEYYSFDIGKEIKNFEIKNHTGLIHLAWEGLRDYKSSHHIDINLPSSLQFIQSLIRKGLSQILVAGTCFEYGKQSGAIKSSIECQPINSYGIAKNELHKSLRQLKQNYNFKLQWTRLFYMYGKGQSSDSLLSQLDTAINNGEKSFNMSSGEQLRDYLPIEKVIQQIYDLYFSTREGTFNICSGKPVSVKSLVEKHIEKSNSSIKLNLGYFPHREYEPMEYWGVKDVYDVTYLPVLPNSPLKSQKQNQSVGPMQLRKNSLLNFVENEGFDLNLIDYSNEYQNSQAYSSKFNMHMNSVLSFLKSRFPKNSRITEIGCGQGHFVEMLQHDGYFKVKGYDASYEGSNASIEKRYLDDQDRLDTDLIVLRHVLEHVKNPYSFLNTLKQIFSKAKIYIEVPNYDWIIENQTFFDITYEHVNYFSQESLQALYEDTRKIHGLTFDDQYQYIIADIHKLNLKFNEYYNKDNWEKLSFNELFPNMKNDIIRLDKIGENRNIFLWGAATKGCLFLAHCKNQDRLIDRVLFAIDQNPQKVGKFMPGSLTPIKSKQDLFATANSGDLLIIANEAYKKEIEEEIIKAKMPELIIETL